MSRVCRGWRTAWTSMQAPAGPGCPTTCGHHWTRQRLQGAEALTSGLWRPSRRGRTRRRRWLRLEKGRRESRRRRARGTRRRTSPASRRGPSCMRTTPGPTSTPAWTWTRPTHRCGSCPLRCRPLPWGAVSGGTAGSMRPRVPTGTASWTRGSVRQGCWRAPWSATSSGAQGRLPGRWPWWPRPRTTARSAVSNWGTRRSWVTTPVMSGWPSPRKASPCRCACQWGACWTRQGSRTCDGKACTWPCGEVGLTLGVASRPCGPSRPRRWGPMRSWWRCTPRVQRSCSARTAC